MNMAWPAKTDSQRLFGGFPEQREGVVTITPNVELNGAPLAARPSDRRERF
jgi:hypothetical protein